MRDIEPDVHAFLKIAQNLGHPIRASAPSAPARQTAAGGGAYAGWSRGFKLMAGKSRATSSLPSPKSGERAQTCSSGLPDSSISPQTARSGCCIPRSCARSPGDDLVLRPAAASHRNYPSTSPSTASARSVSRCAKSLATHYVRVSLVEPGATATELVGHNRPKVLDSIRTQFGQRMESEDIADAIIHIVTRPRHVAVNEMLIRPTEQERWPRRRRSVSERRVRCLGDYGDGRRNRRSPVNVGGS